MFFTNSRRRFGAGWSDSGARSLELRELPPLTASSATDRRPSDLQHTLTSPRRTHTRCTQVDTHLSCFRFRSSLLRCSGVKGAGACTSLDLDAVVAAGIVRICVGTSPVGTWMVRQAAARSLEQCRVHHLKIKGLKLLKVLRASKVLLR